MQRPFATLALLIALVPLPSIAGGDYDGDGKSDLFWRNALTGNNTIWPSAIAAARHNAVSVPNLHWQVVGEGDFDDDGRADVFWRNDSTGENVIWRSGDAATPLTVETRADLQWHVAGIGDFNADGKADVFWRNLATGANAIWQSGNAASVQSVAATGVNWVVAGIGDFNGDGRADVFWRHASTGANVVWPSANAAIRRTEPSLADLRWQVAAIGDFNGDGHADVFWRNLESGRDAFWFSASAAQSGGTVTVPNIAWQIAASGDFDGDGRDDLLWRNLLTGGDVLWRAGMATSQQSLATISDLDWTVVPFEAQPTQPMLAVAVNATASEGNTGSHPALVPVRLSHPSVFPVAYELSTYEAGDCPACAREGSDYVAAQQVAHQIAPGIVRTAAPVTILGDTLPEANEYFITVVYPATGARILWNTTTVRLPNDDANAIWVNSASTIEGNSGTRPLRFTIQLSRPAASAVSFDVATFGRGGLFYATPNEDYLSTSAQLSIPAGATSAQFTVLIIGDLIWEPIGETFFVTLSNVAGVAPVTVPGRGFITDDDEPIIP